MRKLSSLVGYRFTQDFVVFKKVAHLVGSYHQFVYQKSSANLTHSVYTTSYTQNRAMLRDEQVNEFLRKVNRKNASNTQNTSSSRLRVYKKKKKKTAEANIARQQARWNQTRLPALPIDTCDFAFITFETDAISRQQNLNDEWNAYSNFAPIHESNKWCLQPDTGKQQFNTQMI